MSCSVGAGTSTEANSHATPSRRGHLGPMESAPLNKSPTYSNGLSRCVREIKLRNISNLREKRAVLCTQEADSEVPGKKLILSSSENKDGVSRREGFYRLLGRMAMRQSGRRARLATHVIRKHLCSTIIRVVLIWFVLHDEEDDRETLENLVENQREEGLKREKVASGRSEVLGKRL